MRRICRTVSIGALVSACRHSPEDVDASPIAKTDAPTREVETADAPPRTDSDATDIRPACVDEPFVDGPPPREQLERALPKTPTKFGAITCMRGREVWRDAEGRVRVCTIAKRVKTHGLDLAADNYTHFHPDGAPYQTHLAREHALRTADGTEIACAPDLAVLDAAGALELCTLARATTIGEIACSASETVAFHPTGALAACVIAESVDGAGVSFPAGKRLQWHPTGQLAGAWLNEPMRIAGFLARGEAEFYVTGRLRRFELGEARKISGLDLPEGATVWLHEDGSAWHLEFIVDEGFRIHGEPWSDTRKVTFDCAGRITADAIEHFEADGPRFPGTRKVPS